MARTEMIQIPRVEYDRLKSIAELEAIDVDLVKKMLRALNNFRQGKFKEWS